MLVAKFTSLLQKLWSGNYNLIMPADFRHSFVQYASQFHGCRQHDAQVRLRKFSVLISKELLFFLLDALDTEIKESKAIAFFTGEYQSLVGRYIAQLTSSGNLLNL